MSQNIYDEPGLFEGYAQLPRSLHGLAGAPEWPALQAMLPDLAGKRVLDLGCGYGWFCRAARDLFVHHIVFSEVLIRACIAPDAGDVCALASSENSERRRLVTDHLQMLFRVEHEEIRFIRGYR